MQRLDHYLSLAASGDAFSIDASWGQGKTTFGGMSASLALAKLEAAGPEGQLRSLNIHFCGALLCEQPLVIEATALRLGRSVSHYQSSVVQQDQCATYLSACYGAGRESDIVVPPTSIETGPAGAGQTMPFIQGLTPAFMQHIDFTYIGGGFPYSSSQQHHIHGWMRLAEGDNSLTESHLLALIDSWPPTTLQQLKAPAPAATLTWNVELTTPLTTLGRRLSCRDWLYYEAETREAHGGYAHTEARIYTDRGELLALSRQLVSVYDKRNR